MILLLEKKDLEEKLEALTTEVMPADDKPEDTKDLKT